MESVTVEHETGAARQPSGSKSDDSSPRREGGRSSPPPNCAICLGTCRNKSFTDSCLHQFCFKCLLTWSKVKAECPLCKQVFKSIIHNVRSNQQYDEYTIEQRHEETTQTDYNINIDLQNSSRRFRYRTTLTLLRRETLALQQLLLHHYPLVAPPSSRCPRPRSPPPSRRRHPAAFRRTVYRHNLWARPLPDFTGRFRDCTPEFYRYNDSQMHRLVPWLQRELSYLLNDNAGHIAYVMSRILELLPQYHITSSEFREAMTRYFGEHTEHFLHELYCFAATPYDMTGYDRNVQYTTDSRMSTMVSEVLSSSESDASVDSDIVMVSSSHPAEAGPSAPPRVLSQPDQVIPIESLSQSDSGSDDEVMLVGYVKPPAQRTPEVVDLLGSDSDVVLTESQPEPAPSGSGAEPTRPLVKFTLKRPRSATTSDTDRSTPYASSYVPSRSPSVTSLEPSPVSPRSPPGHPSGRPVLGSPRPVSPRYPPGYSSDRYDLRSFRPVSPRSPPGHPNDRYVLRSSRPVSPRSPPGHPSDGYVLRSSRPVSPRSPPGHPSDRYVLRSPRPGASRVLHTPSPVTSRDLFTPSPVPSRFLHTPSPAYSSVWSSYSDSSSSSDGYERRRRRRTKKRSKKRSKHCNRSVSPLRHPTPAPQRRTERKSRSGRGIKTSQLTPAREQSLTPPLASIPLASIPLPPSAPSHNPKRLKSVVNIINRNDCSPGTSTSAQNNKINEREKKSPMRTPPLQVGKRETTQEGASSSHPFTPTTPPLHSYRTTNYSDSDTDDDLPLNLCVQINNV